MSDTANPAPRQQHGERGQERREEFYRKWFNECIRGTSIGRNVDCWNDAQKALEELIQRDARHRG